MEILAAHGLTVLHVKAATALFADATHAPGGLEARGVAAGAVGIIGSALGRPLPVLHAEQRHTARSFVYEAKDPLAAGAYSVGECDGLITAERDVALLVVTADCLPVVLAGDEVAAVVHAGWRGLASDILGAVVRRLWNEFGVPASALGAAIGVGIGPCHYLVGSEVVQALASHPVATGDWVVGEAVDLGLWAAGRLGELGLAPASLLRLPGCTACSALHHSYRRDGSTAGRQWCAAVLQSL